VIVTEEIVWRLGILLPVAAHFLYPKSAYRTGSKASTGWLATIVMASVWSGLHYPFLGNIYMCLYGVLLGVALNSMVLRSQSITPSIICHITFWIAIINAQPKFLK